MRYQSLAAPDMRTKRVKLAIAESLFSGTGALLTAEAWETKMLIWEGAFWSL